MSKIADWDNRSSNIVNQLKCLQSIFIASCIFRFVAISIENVQLFNFHKTKRQLKQITLNYATTK